MNNQDNQLKHRVAGMTVPPCDADRMDEALRLSLSILHQRPSPVASGISHRLVMKFTAAGLTAAVIAGILLTYANKARPTSPNLAGPCELSLDVWNEIGRLFPDQLDAIIAKGGRMDLQLSDSLVGCNTDQAVKIICKSERDSCTIITYSGRDVNIHFDGLPLRISPLINGDGTVIVMTQDRVVSPPGSSSSDALQISATTLAKR